MANALMGGWTDGQGTAAYVACIAGGRSALWLSLEQAVATRTKTNANAGRIPVDLC
jgi:hypothetical protein